MPKKQGILKVKDKKARNRALAFAIPVLAIIATIYMWTFWHINNDGEIIGMTPELRLIFGVMAFFMLKNQIFRPILRKVNKITRDIAGGKSLRQQIDERIPLEEEII